MITVEYVSLSGQKIKHMTFCSFQVMMRQVKLQGNDLSLQMRGISVWLGHFVTACHMFQDVG